VSDDVIRFSAIVYKVQTLVDGGLRLTLDLPENAIEQVTQLIQCKRGGAVLEVAAVPIKTDGRTDESRKIHI
jgi:hypothetical protein